MIITTTNSIENSKITKYLGVVSGTDIYLVGGLFGGGLANQEHLYTPALNNAIEKMRQKAAALGANAIVGVSTNIASPGDLNNIIVVATGTAVVIKTDGDSDTSTAPELDETVYNISTEEQDTIEDEDIAEEIEDDNLVPDPSKEDPENELPCPHCGIDLSIMGLTENDLKIPQVCPWCEKEILLEK